MRFTALNAGPALRRRALVWVSAVLLVVACGAVLGISRQQQAGPALGTSTDRPATSSSRAPLAANLEVEALLYRTMRDISANQLDSALGEINKVIGTYPHFRLAHLIKGDLLLARRQPITTLGNASKAPAELLEALREEARVRIARHRHARPVGQIPLYLVQLSPEQRHAIVVDTSKSTLYVFRHERGELRYVADYYTTIGKKGIEKNREGDQKTPLGVYHVTTSIPRQKLTDFYGAGAFPINYPNEWDRRQGRNGYGIWLHGTPFDTYSRPPRSSDGCVVLTNEDLQSIAGFVQVGVTPVIIADRVEWVKVDGAQALREELGREIEQWRRDWESRDTDRYLSHYSAEFAAGKLDRDAWADRKRALNARKDWISVKLDAVSMYLYPGRDDLVVVTFDQAYSSSNLHNRMRKRQYWLKEGESWRIVHEGAA